MPADALLHEAFATMRHSAGLYADRRPPALTGVEAVAVEHRLHVEQRQQLAVEGSRRFEPADRQDNSSISIVMAPPVPPTSAGSPRATKDISAAV